MNEQTQSGFSIEQINKAVEAMVKAQDRVSKTVAQVIVMALWAANGGNKSADVANTLVRNLRKGIRKTLVVDLLQTHGNLAFASGNFVYFDAKKGYTEDEVKAYKEAAANWESFKVVKEDVEIDALEAFEALLTKLDKKAAAKLVTNDAAIEKMKALLGSLKGAALLG